MWWGRARARKSSISSFRRLLGCSEQIQPQSNGGRRSDYNSTSKFHVTLESAASLAKIARTSWEEISNSTQEAAPT